MAYVLQFLTLADGSRDEHCGQYLVGYQPAFHPPNADYDGGLLVTSPNFLDAQKFDSAIEAVEVWRTQAPCPCHNLRPDGKPNRPLTAYTVMPVAVQ